jgi:hypothetical protein
MRQPHQCAYGLLCVLIVGLAACDSRGSSPEPDEGIEDLRDSATLLVEEDEGPIRGVAWSPETDELLYMGDFGLKAVDVASGAVRTVYASPGAYRGVSRATVAADGRTVYAVQYPASDDAALPRLLRISLRGDTAKMVIPRIRDALAYAASPDDAHLAYAVDDSLILYDRWAGDRTVLLTGAIADPMAFSPDGRQLVYTDQGVDLEYPFSTLSVEDGTAERVPFARPTPTFSTSDAQVRWLEDGIRILYRALIDGRGGYYLYNASDDVTRTLLLLSHSASRILFWSRAGDVALGGETQYIHDGALAEHTLWTLHPMTYRSSEIARYNTCSTDLDSCEFVAMSKLQQLAFASESSIYVLDLP